MKRVLKFTGVLTLVALAIGLLIGLISSWTILSGIYMAFIFMSLIMMLISIFYLIGSPKKRLDYIIKRQYKDKESKDTLYDALGPIFMAIWFMVLGFVIESLGH